MRLIDAFWLCLRLSDLRSGSAIFELLGSAIGTPERLSEFVARKIQRQETKVDRLKELSAQCGWLLLKKWCVAPTKLVHLLRTIDTTAPGLRVETQKIDNLHARFVEQHLKQTNNPVVSQLTQVIATTLPVDKGGMGLPTMTPSDR